MPIKKVSYSVRNVRVIGVEMCVMVSITVVDWIGFVVISCRILVVIRFCVRSYGFLAVGVEDSSAGVEDGFKMGVEN